MLVKGIGIPMPIPSDQIILITANHLVIVGVFFVRLLIP
jgi:hypothetical protein